MKSNRRYLGAVALLIFLAVVFGVFGTVAPPLAEEVKPSEASSSSSPSSTSAGVGTSSSMAHFTNPPTYDSGWVNITDKCGQSFNITHNLNTTEVFVDITGKTAILTDENWHQFWSMGDVNRDGYINDADRDFLMAAFDTTPGDPNWNPDADLNQDFVIDIFDAEILNSHYGLEIWTYFVAGIHQRHLGLTSYIPGWISDSLGYNIVFPSIIKTWDGGYATASVALFEMGGSNSGLYITDSFGRLKYSRTFSTSANLNNEVNSLIRTIDTGPAPGYAMAGFTGDPLTPNSLDAWLVKVGWGDEFYWDKTYGTPSDDRAFSLVQTTWDYGFAMAGVTYSVGNGDFWLVKTDQDGNFIWSRTYGGPNADCGYDLVEAHGGGYIIAGTGVANLLKYDVNGVFQWAKTYGGNAYSLVKTSDGGYALAGELSGNCWLVKTHADGEMQWSRTYGGGTAHSLVQTADGGYALAAGRLLIKTDSAGIQQWNIENPLGLYARDVVQTADGGYAFAGSQGMRPEEVIGLLFKTSVEPGLAWTNSTDNVLMLYRGKTDMDWNFVRVRVWTIQEPTWQYGDINQDGVVDAKDLYIVGRNYGKTFSALSLGGIAAIAGIRTVKKRKRQDS